MNTNTETIRAASAHHSTHGDRSTSCSLLSFERTVYLHVSRGGFWLLTLQNTRKFTRNKSESSLRALICDRISTACVSGWVGVRTWRSRDKVMLQVSLRYVWLCERTSHRFVWGSSCPGYSPSCVPCMCATSCRRSVTTCQRVCASNNLPISLYHSGYEMCL